MAEPGDGSLDRAGAGGGASVFIASVAGAGETAASCSLGEADAVALICGATLSGTSAGLAAGGGVSTLNNASVGVSFCANLVSGVTRHDGLEAKSSCAARSNAAAPSPNTTTDIDSRMAASRKRMPGSIAG